jgi:hypothetical protein
MTRPSPLSPPYRIDHEYGPLSVDDDARVLVQVHGRQELGFVDAVDLHGGLVREGRGGGAMWMEVVRWGLFETAGFENALSWRLQHTNTSGRA